MISVALNRDKRVGGWGCSHGGEPSAVIKYGDIVGYLLRY